MPTLIVDTSIGNVLLSKVKKTEGCTLENYLSSCRMFPMPRRSTARIVHYHATALIWTTGD